MTFDSFCVPHASKHAIAIDAIFPKTRKSSGKSKIYCNSIPAFIGPWRAAIQAWHAPGPGKQGRARFRAAAGTDGAGTVAFRTASTAGQVRTALRRERQLGIAGHPSYSVDRHDQLRRALNEVEAEAAKGGIMESQAMERRTGGLRQAQMPTSDAAGCRNGVTTTSQRRGREDARVLH